MADDIYNLNLAENRRFRDWMGQSSATSGQVPRQSALDSIIQNELDAAYDNVYRRKQLQLYYDQLAQNQEQFETAQENAMDTAAAERKAGLLGTGMQAATTYGLYKALAPAKPPVIIPTTIPATELSATGLTAMTAGAGEAAAPPLSAYGATAMAPTVETLAPISVAGETTLSAIPASATGESLLAGTTLGGETTALTGAEGATGLSGYGTAALPYLAPAAAGYFGSELGGNIATQIGEAIGLGGESEQSFIGNVGGGALAGAAIGSIVPGVGTGIGAAIGAGVGLIDWGFTGGKDFVSDLGKSIGNAAEDLWDSTIGSIF
jgi:hypothetical protein